MSETYDVYRDQTGDSVVRGVSLEVAERECARLNREAEAGEIRHLGVRVTYSVGRAGHPPASVRPIEPPAPDVSSDEWYVLDPLTMRTFGRDLSYAEAAADADARNKADDRAAQNAYIPTHENQLHRLPGRMLGSSTDAKRIIAEEKKPIDWTNWPTQGERAE